MLTQESGGPMIPIQWGFEDEFGERVIDLAATLGVSILGITIGMFLRGE
jgi:hypothetical protein